MIVIGKILMRGMVHFVLEGQVSWVEIIVTVENFVVNVVKVFCLFIVGVLNLVMKIVQVI